MFQDIAEQESNSVLSVTAAALKIKNTIESNFRNISIQGEITGLKKHSSGHSYFGLRDCDTTLDSICWRGTQLNIKLEDGVEVIATGRVTTYMNRSKYQFIVEGVKVAGIGALLKLLEERKQKLIAQGLTTRIRKSIPSFPSIIGVITSSSGSVIQDILHRISARYPCHVVVWPVMVQGVEASKQIANAITGFNNVALKPDVLIVARGGGSVEDLWCFNEEEVALAAANSNIALISAIGHETDTTLIDYVSDLRAPTPTAAAELCTPVRIQLLQSFSEFETRIFNATYQKLENLQTHLINLIRALPKPIQIIEQTMLRLNDWSERLLQALRSIYKQNSIKLKIKVNFPNSLLHNNKQVLDLQFGRLDSAFKTYLSKLLDGLLLLYSGLRQNSYQQTLKRGFCLAYANNEPIKNAFQLRQVNTAINLKFHDGEALVLLQNTTTQNEIYK